MIHASEGGRRWAHQPQLCGDDDDGGHPDLADDKPTQDVRRVGGAANLIDDAFRRAYASGTHFAFGLHHSEGWQGFLGLQCSAGEHDWLGLQCRFGSHDQGSQPTGFVTGNAARTCLRNVDNALEPKIDASDSVRTFPTGQDRAMMHG